MDPLSIDWRLVRGETRAWKVTVTEDGSPYDLTGATLELAVAPVDGPLWRRSSLELKEAVLCKDNGSNGGISILVAAAGTARILFDSADTEELTGTRYLVQLHLTGAAGDRTTLASGQLTLLQNAECAES